MAQAESCSPVSAPGYVPHIYKLPGALISALLLFISCSSIPQERPAQPENRNPLEYIQILESAERVKNLQVERVVEHLNLEEGDVVADIGSGSGLFTIPIAEKVGPGGKVYAVDIEEELLQYVQAQALRGGLNNVETVLADELDPRIPQKVDFVLMCDTLSYISDKPIYLQGLTRYLKPGASVAIIDREGEWPPHLEQGKYTVQELDRWMNNAGLERVETYRFHTRAFFNIYRFEGR